MAAATPGRRVLRAASATVVLIATAALAAFLLIDAFARAGVIRGLLLAPWVLLVMWAVYVFAYVSSVEVDASGVRVRNTLRIIDVPWSSIDDIVMNWQLELHLRGGEVVRAFGGPAGRRPRRMPRAAELPGQLAGSGAERDVEWLRERWAVAEASANSDGVRRSWDTRALIVLAVLALWALVAVLITGGPS